MPLLGTLSAGIGASRVVQLKRSVAGKRDVVPGGGGSTRQQEDTR